ncbi:MAG TPA: hypothetical protein VET24_12030, partial [Actinomycetota bacterium]|nr:hypothetical protein [Actinomycetota bacterium]
MVDDVFRHQPVQSLLVALRPSLQQGPNQFLGGLLFRRGLLGFIGGWLRLFGCCFLGGLLSGLLGCGLLSGLLGCGLLSGLLGCGLLSG